MSESSKNWVQVISVKPLQICIVWKVGNRIFNIENLWSYHSNRQLGDAWSLISNYNVPFQHLYVNSIDSLPIYSLQALILGNEEFDSYVLVAETQLQQKLFVLVISNSFLSCASYLNLSIWIAGTAQKRAGNHQHKQLLLYISD